MTQACRDKLIQAPRSESDNAGLLLASYLKEQDEGSKKEITNNACDACKRVDPVYGMAFRRWKEQLPPNTRTAVVSTLGRFVTGLGTASALETGIRLHHTYGTPVIPGSGLKGLASHYCHRIWGERDTDQVLFGDLEKSGLIIFHDAWMLPEDLQGNVPWEVAACPASTSHQPQIGP